MVVSLEEAFVRRLPGETVDSSFPASKKIQSYCIPREAARGRYLNERSGGLSPVPHLPEAQGLGENESLKRLRRKPFFKYSATRTFDMHRLKPKGLLWMRGRGLSSPVV